MFVRGFRARWALITIASCLLAGRATAQQDSVAMPAPTLDLTFRVHGYIQVYYRAGDPLTKDRFRLQETDLKFDGDVSPRLKWRVTFDAGKLLTLNTKATEISDTVALSDAAVDQKSKLLQDAALTYFINRNLNFDIGQQVIPMSLEGKIQSSQVETIERNLFTSGRSRAVGLADVRDVGVTANGFALNTIEFHAGVFNERATRRERPTRISRRRSSAASRSTRRSCRRCNSVPLVRMRAVRLRRSDVAVERRFNSACPFHPSRRIDVGARWESPTLRMVRAWRAPTDVEHPARRAL